MESRARSLILAAVVGAAALATTLVATWFAVRWPPDYDETFVWNLQATRRAGHEGYALADGLGPGGAVRGSAVAWRMYHAAGRFVGGRRLISLRGISVLAGVIAVVGVCALALRLGAGRAGAAAAAWILATQPTVWAASAAARPDMPLAAWLVVSALVATVPGRWGWLAAGAMAGLAPAWHPNGVVAFWLIPCVAWISADGMRKVAAVLWSSVGVAVGATAALLWLGPYMPAVVEQMHLRLGGAAPWHEPPALLGLGAAFSAEVQSLWAPYTTFPLLASWPALRWLWAWAALAAAGAAAAFGSRAVRAGLAGMALWFLMSTLFLGRKEAMYAPQWLAWAAVIIGTAAARPDRRWLLVGAAPLLAAQLAVDWTYLASRAAGRAYPDVMRDVRAVIPEGARVMGHPAYAPGLPGREFREWMALAGPGGDRRLEAALRAFRPQFIIRDRDFDGTFPGARFRGEMVARVATGWTRPAGPVDIMKLR